MSHPDVFAALTVGALCSIAATIPLLVTELRRIVTELREIRQDNVAWRENVWNRDNRKSR